jgi:ribosomal protein S18 acetylase RimI-like enzyme
MALAGQADEAVVVRPAAMADLGRLAELYEAAMEELSALRGGQVLAALEDRAGEVARSFEGELADRLACTAVAEAPGSAKDAAKIVGYGSCRIVEMQGGGRLGRIRELYVVPEARRAGVGRALTELLVGWCRAQGCIGVDANALPGSRTQKSFFESERFTARLLVMYRPLL